MSARLAASTVLIALLLALFTGSDAFLAFAAAVFVLHQVSHRLASDVRRRLSLHLRARPRALFQGEDVVLQLQVQNPSPLPCAAVDLQVDTPATLQPTDGLSLQSHHQAGRRLLRAVLSLRGREQVRLTRTFRAIQRGYLQFGPASAQVTPALGETVAVSFADHESVTVYPALVPLRPQALNARRPAPEMAARSLLEDELRFLTLREYQPGDPLRRLHAATSLRRGVPMVRTFEQATEPTCMLFVNMATAEHAWEGIAVELLETALSLAASLAVAYFEQGAAIGLIANGALPEEAGRREMTARLRPSRHPEQVRVLLSVLGALVPAAQFFPLARVIQQQARQMAIGTHCIVISPYWNAALETALAALRQAGHSTVAMLPRNMLQDVSSANQAWEDVLLAST